MKHLLCIVILFLGGHFSVFAQNVGNCVTGSAKAYLDVGNVKARILNVGGLFWNGDPADYFVPKNGTASAIFASGFWMGGYDSQNQLRIAGATYGSWEFWPGVLDEVGNPPKNCAEYDRIYKVSASDIKSYEEGNPPSKDLAEWAFQLGAPVVDGDGNPNNYNLAGGDRPEMLGDQTIWWVMNDLGNKHLRTNALPLGIEVRVTAFASIGAADATFYRYQVKYKGKEPLKKVVMSMFVDPDVGASSDDGIGTDTTMALGFAYNLDEFDEGDNGYGESPAAIGYVLLQTPTQNGRETGMGYFHANYKSLICGDPANGLEYYYAMTARCKDGSYQKPFTRTATPDNPPNYFDLPGDPITKQGWSSENFDGLGNQIFMSDKRFNISSGMFDMNPGDEQTFAFAILWAQAKNSRLGSLKKLKLMASSVYLWRKAIMESGPPPLNLGPPPAEFDKKAEIIQQDLKLILRQNAPNPATGDTEIPFWLPYPSRVSLKVYDVLGREVATILEEKREGGSHFVRFDVRTLPQNGVYLCRLVAHDLRLAATMRMTVFKN